jgi:hypothetical protein
MATENKNLSDYDKIQSKRKNFRFGIVVSNGMIP